MPPIDDGRIFAEIGGAGFTDLVARFYAKVRADDLIGPMYPADDWANAEWRLRMFLIQRFGGPQAYSEQRGHPRLRLRHAPFPITRAAAQRWLTLMGHSLQESVDAGTVAVEAAEVLWSFLRNTAAAMVNQDEPAGAKG